MDSKCSAIVLSYNRLSNLPPIVDNLRQREWIDDIHVWHQGDGIVSLATHKVRAHRSDNYLRYGRFVAMEYVDHDAVLVQDDDAVSRNLDELWKQWQADPERIAALLHPGHYKSDERRRWGPCHEVLLGWGAILDRRWRQVFDLWQEAYGMNELVYRKADRIFAILQQRHHNILRADCTNLQGSCDDSAAWKQPDHDAATVEARDKCLNGILKLGIARKEFARR